MPRHELHPTLGPGEHACDFVLEPEALLLQPFEPLVGRLFLGLNAKDLAIDRVVTAGHSPKQVVGLSKPRNEHGLVGKLVGQARAECA
jgi:hypothetical protein